MSTSNRFRFTDATGLVAALEVSDSSGSASLELFYELLLGIRVQLVRASEEVDCDGRKMFELSVCELDGGKLAASRRRAVIARLESALSEGAPVAARPKQGASKKSLRAA